MPKTTAEKLGGEPKKIEPKRPYVSPRLIVYGSVTKLTAGQGGTVFDPGHEVPTKTGQG